MHRTSPRRPTGALVAAAACGAALLLSRAHAADMQAPLRGADAVARRELDRTRLVAVWVGYHDVINGPLHTPLAGVEYRGGRRCCGLRPAAGAFASARGFTYVYGGVRWEIAARRIPLEFAVGTAAGYYEHGDDLRLYFPLEFRSGVELYWTSPGGRRLGLGFHHLSNALLGPHNPGTEILSAMYAFPLALRWPATATSPAPASRPRSGSAPP